MERFSELWRRLLYPFGRRRFDRDLEEEMRFHLEMKAAESGAAAARRQFGNQALLLEDSRDAWGWRWLDRLGQDIRFAVRLMRRNGIVTTLAVLTLALGIGANTAVFSLVEAVVLRPLPYPEPQRLFMLWPMDSKGRASMSSSYPDFRDWQQQSRSFEAMSAFHADSFNLTGGPEPERVDALFATPNLFEVLGIQPVLGRTFANGEEDERVVVLDHRLWVRRFGGDPKVVGRTIQLDGRAYTVIGIFGPDFRFMPRHFAGDPELFVPLAPNADRAGWWARVLGRVRRGVSEQRAQSEMDAITRGMAPSSQDKTDRGRAGVKLEALDHYALADAGYTAMLLLGAVSFVLLIACANVANLLLSQGAVRQREIAVRIALGAPRRRLIRQLLTESALLAGIGGTAGVAMARWGLPLLTAIAPERTAFLSRLQDNGVQLNWTVLAFTAVISFLAASMFGIVPAWKSTQPVNSSARSFRGGNLRGGLIAIEVALSFVLLAGAGLMMKNLSRLLAVDLGIRTERLLTMSTSLPAAYSDSQKQIAFFQHALDRLQALPGALSVGGVVDLPLTRAISVESFEMEGAPAKKGRATFHSASPGYFRTMGIPLIRGRVFADRDTDVSESVGVVNRTMAGRYWPDQDPVGRALLINRGVPEQTAAGTRRRVVPQRVEIVGVVGDVRDYGLDRDPPAELYLPYPQRPSREMTLVMRTAADPVSLIPKARKEIWRIDPDQPIADIKTMDEWVSTDTAPRRFILILIGVFASVAVALAAAGIYGVISYSVTQRTREIGIRMALGAERRGVMWWVLRQTLGWLAAGIAVGGAGALGLTRLLGSYLVGVASNDPVVFGGVALGLVLVSFSANALPALRAMRIDPMEALRYE